MTASALDRLVNQLICDAEAERLRDQSVPLSQFTIQRRARDLAPFAEARAVHHREREAHYTKELAEAEKKLKSEGITMMVRDQGTGLSYSVQNVLASGGPIAPGNVFQPQVNQEMLQAVERVKAKVLEHRGKAQHFAGQARILGLAHPGQMIELTVADVESLQLTA